jgi:hypothetical protein
MYRMKKKRLFSKLTWAALALVLALAFTACSDLLGMLDDDDDDPVNAATLTELTTLIGQAETVKNGVVTDSTDGTSTNSGTFWVPPLVMNSLDAAIDAANAINSNSTQKKAEDAKTALQNAYNAFTAAKKDGTKSALIVSALNKKIAEAENEKAKVIVAEKAGDVPDGAAWAKATQVDALTTAIEAAESAKNTAATEADVTTAVNNLDAAIDTFKNAVTGNGSGSKTTGFSQDDFADLIAKANTAKTGVRISTDGDDIPPTEFWVTQSVLDTLEAAISAASGTAAPEDQDYLTLNTALSVFNRAKQTGTVPNTSSLLNALESASAARVNVEIAASRDQVPSGKDWVTQTQWDALNTAYTAALTAANSGTQDQVDKAVTALTNATNAFNSAKTANGTGTAVKENKITITGLGAIYGNNTKVQLGLAETVVIESPAIYGEGTITGGSLAVSLYKDNAVWAGSGSYYIAFMAKDDIVAFVSKQKIAFSGAAVTIAYADFELPVTSLKLSDFGESFSSMTLNAFLQAATQDMPGGPYNYNNWKSAMKSMMEQMVVAKISLDYTLYKNEACTQQFSGGDTVTPNTVIYCKAPIPFGSSDSTDPKPNEPSNPVEEPKTLEEFKVFIIREYAEHSDEMGDQFESFGLPRDPNNWNDGQWNTAWQYYQQYGPGGEDPNPNEPSNPVDEPKTLEEFKRVTIEAYKNGSFVLPEVALQAGFPRNPNDWNEAQWEIAWQYFSSGSYGPGGDNSGTDSGGDSGDESSSLEEFKKLTIEAYKNGSFVLPEPAKLAGFSPDPNDWTEAQWNMAWQYFGSGSYAPGGDSGDGSTTVPGGDNSGTNPGGVISSRILPIRRGIRTIH